MQSALRLVAAMWRDGLPALQFNESRRKDRIEKLAQTKGMGHGRSRHDSK
jgi:hypothetical protein